MRGDVGFSLNVHVLRAVKPRWRAGTYPVGTEDLDGTLLEMRVGTEGVKVVGCEIDYRAAI